MSQNWKLAAACTPLLAWNGPEVPEPVPHEVQVGIRLQVSWSESDSLSVLVPAEVPISEETFAKLEAMPGKTPDEPFEEDAKL